MKMTPEERFLRTFLTNIDVTGETRLQELRDLLTMKGGAAKKAKLLHLFNETSSPCIHFRRKLLYSLLIPVTRMDPKLGRYYEEALYEISFRISIGTYRDAK